MESEAMKFKFSGYGVHPTVYGAYNDKDLYGMFRSDVWSRMNENQRQQLLQETVNRVAKSMGEKGACEVRFADLPSNVYGQQSGNVIELNRNNFALDKRTHQSNGYKFVLPFEHSNYMALQTVLHENIHAWQNQLIDKTINNADKELIAQYTANNFTSSMIVDHTADNKKILRQGSQYMNGVTPGYGYQMYYLQATERDAHKFGERQALNIMNYNLKNYGPDPTAEKFKEEVRLNGYQAQENEAKKIFNNENIERDINNTLLNHYYGMNRSVDPETAKKVDHEMAESYKKQQGIGQNSNASEQKSAEKSRAAWNGEPPDAGKSEHKLAEQYQEALSRGDLKEANNKKEILDRYEDNRQAARDVAEKATPLQHELDDVVKDVSEELGFEYTPLREGKSTDSMLSKVADRQKADNVESINDLYRDKIQMNSFQDTKAASESTIQRLREKDFNILGAEVKDNKESGYKGLHLTVEKNGLGGELQFTTAEHWNCKEKSDAIYDNVRELDERFKRNEKLSPEEMKTLLASMEESRKLWNEFDAKDFNEAKDAFKAVGEELQSQRGGQSASETAEPSESLSDGSTHSPSTSSSNSFFSFENRNIRPSLSSNGRPSQSDNSAMSQPPENDTKIVSENDGNDKKVAQTAKENSNLVSENVGQSSDSVRRFVYYDTENDALVSVDSRQKYNTVIPLGNDETDGLTAEGTGKPEEQTNDPTEEKELADETATEEETAAEEVSEDEVAEEEEVADEAETEETAAGEAAEDEVAEEEEVADEAEIEEPAEEEAAEGEEVANEAETEEATEEEAAEENQADELVAENEATDEVVPEENAAGEDQANDLTAEDEVEDEIVSEENTAGEDQADDLVAEDETPDETAAEENTEVEDRADDLVAANETEDETVSEENTAGEDQADDLVAANEAEDETVSEENTAGEDQADDLVAANEAEDETVSEENTAGEDQADDLVAEEETPDETAAEENAAGEDQASDLTDGESVDDSAPEGDEESEDEEQSYGY